MFDWLHVKARSGGLHRQLIALRQPDHHLAVEGLPDVPQDGLQHFLQPHSDGQVTAEQVEGGGVAFAPLGGPELLAHHRGGIADHQANYQQPKESDQVFRIRDSQGETRLYKYIIEGQHAED